jgi:cytochrome c oxidase cbb3-type subunit 2/cytochrome c oxidase cbb3-type subunit I/II
MWPRGRPGLTALLLVLAACGGDPERAGGMRDAGRGGSAVAHGQSVYDLRCAPCHGTAGGGDGPAAAAITPKPRNFRDAEFWKGRTVEQLRLVVKQGRPGTLMPPFEGVLSDAEIDDVVAYVQSFRPSAS